MRILNFISNLLRNKNQSDLFFNYCSLVLLALCGVVINVILGIYYGPEGPGVFNQFYVIFIIAGQAATAGLHNATLRFAAEHLEEPKATHQLIASSLLITSLFAVAVAVLISCSGRLYEIVFKASKVGEGLFFLGPASFLFAFNKVLLGVVNGQHRMKLFGFATAFRSVLMLGFVCFFANQMISIQKISQIFFNVRSDCFIISLGKTFEIYVKLDAICFTYFQGLDSALY